MVLLIKDALRPLARPSIFRELRQKQQERADFYSRFVRPGDLVFDVGANLGNRCTAFLSLGANVVAIEPQHLCYKYLRLRFGKRISVERLAVGAKAGIARIRVNSASTTISSMSSVWIDKMKQGRFSSTNWDSSEEVTVQTLDELIGKYGTPEFIKIDVEGYEAEALKGLTSAVECLSFEFTTPEMSAEARSCVERLHSLSGQYRFNFSVGEQCRLELASWESYAEFSGRLESNIDSLGGFGDIYAKLFR